MYGRRWCTAAGREGADLWVKIWNLLADIGGGVVVRKVKAHTTDRDVHEGRTTRSLQAGNSLADKHAKLGAAKSAELSSPAALEEEYAKAIRY